MEIPGATPEYLMHDRRQIHEDEAATYSIVRVSDGQTVRTIEKQSTDSAEWPRLVDRSYVRLFRPSSGPWYVEVRDVETGALTDTIEIGTRGFAHADDEWVLAARGGATTGENHLSVVWPDGRELPVSGTWFSVPRWVGGDSSVAYVTESGKSYEIDPATGGIAPVTFPDPKAVLWAVTPTRLYGHARTWVDGAYVERFWIRDRGTGETVGPVDVADDPRMRTLYPHGEGLAALYIPDGSSISGTVLRPVDLATGELLRAVATDVLAARRMEDGRIALAVGDVPTGRLAVTPEGAGGVRHVTDLPRIAERVADVGLSGDTVAASWLRTAGVWTTRADGGGSWAASDPDLTFEDDRERPLRFAGDTVLVEEPRQYFRDPHRYRIGWPGGSRAFESRSSASLANGGRYVVRGVPGTKTTEVQETRTGTVVTSWTDDGLGRVLDGDTLWSAPDAAAVMTGTYVTGRSPKQGVQLPADCASQSLRDVRGRWARLACRQGNVVVDLWSVMDPYVLPASKGYIGLGNGFVAWVDYVQETQWGDPTILLRVVDLSPGNEVRSYGQLRGEGFPPGPDFAVNDDGSPEIVYVDPESQVRRIDVSWIGSAPTTRPDRTAPVLRAGPGLAPAVASKDPVHVEASWTYVDVEQPHEPQSGLSSYDLRYRDRLPDGGYADWVAPDAWQGTDRAVAEATLAPGETRCFAARATDRAGNTSAWSEQSCVYVDGAAPRLSRATGSPRFPTKMGRPVAYRYGATDDDTVTTYDVARRSAPRGKPLGAWRTVLSATKRTDTSIQGRPGSQHCFRFRARDRAGNVSAWSAPRCSVMPVDDHELVTRGRAVSLNSDQAIVGTYTRLKQRGASTTLKAQTGRRVGVWVLRRPGHGKADVYAAGRRLGRISFNGPFVRRVLVMLPATRRFSGAVRVVQVTDRPVQVDAVVVVR